MSLSGRVRLSDEFVLDNAVVHWFLAQLRGEGPLWPDFLVKILRLGPGSHQKLMDQLRRLEKKHLLFLRRVEPEGMKAVIAVVPTDYGLRICYTRFLSTIHQRRYDLSDMFLRVMAEHLSDEEALQQIDLKRRKYVDEVMKLRVNPDYPKLQAKLKDLLSPREIVEMMKPAGFNYPPIPVTEKPWIFLPWWDWFIEKNPTPKEFRKALLYPGRRLRKAAEMKRAFELDLKDTPAAPPYEPTKWRPAVELANHIRLTGVLEPIWDLEAD